MTDKHNEHLWSYETQIAKPDVNIQQTYLDVYDEIMDVLESEATLGPIDETTFKEVAFEIIERLIDMANNDYQEEETE